ncbi:hypothetical protein GCM10022600_17150 [Qipengyuania pelagi]|jgi:hypothetical protein|uniref:Uncharacterized protein n=1 Tax=Qipengyuania pelagi TaxID=994320 RepID=A0A844Y653_9SPHN|nr:hypothetical protein [Qipengyuania pelagi]MXO53431.1 hypothetical protein [Qipengyuania pelagi]
MTAPSAYKQADLVKILKATNSAGLTPHSLTVHPHTGDITVTFDPTASGSKKNTFDEIMSKLK